MAEALLIVQALDFWRAMTLEAYSIPAAFGRDLGGLQLAIARICLQLISWAWPAIFVFRKHAAAVSAICGCCLKVGIANTL